MRYASLALRTLSRLDLMSSRGISSMSEALWSLERKCSETVVGLELFVCLSTGLSTGETRHITHHIDCNSKNVIYMVHCNRCHKQYIGETKRRLKDRFNEHRRPVDKQTNSSKPTTVSEHFLSNDHNASDMLLIPLELIKSNRDSVRKAREAYLIDRGQTIEPLGLNRRDET